MFCPGETICHSFILPFLPQDISKVVVSYKACDDIFFEKIVTSDNTMLNGAFEQYDETHSILKYILDQDESLLFPENHKFKIQINVLTKGGSRHTSLEIEDIDSYQHIKNILSFDYESEGMSIVKEAYYTVFGYPY